MRALQLIKRFATNPQIRFGYITKFGCYDRLPDDVFLKKQYRVLCGKEPDLFHPKSFNEKIQYLKLHDRNPAYTNMVDKYAVKEYVEQKTDRVKVFPALGVWDEFDEIPFERLPEQFVLKCTHDSGSIIICREKSRLDKKKAKKRLQRALKRNYYYSGREWTYKNVKPRIMAEAYYSDESGTELKDYKVFVFQGKPRLIELDYNRFGEGGHHRNLYTPDWELMDVEIQYPSDKRRKFEKPSFLEEMLETAAELSDGIPFVRVDFYAIGDDLYFGEFTFYPDGGTGEFRPASFGIQMGEWIEIDKIYDATGKKE